MTLLPKQPDASSGTNESTALYEAAFSPRAAQSSRAILAANGRRAWEKAGTGLQHARPMMVPQHLFIFMTEMGNRKA
jgi:hypothetical protein